MVQAAVTALPRLVFNLIFACHGGPVRPRWFNLLVTRNWNSVSGRRARRRRTLKCHLHQVTEKFVVTSNFKLCNLKPLGRRPGSLNLKIAGSQAGRVASRYVGCCQCASRPGGLGAGTRTQPELTRTLNRIGVRAGLAGRRRGP